MKRYQAGMSYYVMAVLVALGVSLVLIGAKVVPVYSEYFTLKKIFKELGNEAQNMSPSDIRAAYERKATIGYITVIQNADMQIEKRGDGTTVSADYTQKVPLIANVSLYFEFHVEGGKGSGGKAAIAAAGN